MIRIIHITSDDKFFDGPIKRFESDHELDNQAYLSSFGHIHLNYIKSTEKIIVLKKKRELKQVLEKGNYDVVFFYSLPFERWWMVDAIPKDKIIIWWAWGYELYGHSCGLRPLIDINLYKPITKKYVKGRFRTKLLMLLYFVRFRFQRDKLLKQRNRILSRIDYLMPVLPIEFELLKKHHEFRAKLFHYTLEGYNFEYNSTRRSPTGGILLGNSSLVSNNHLDVWEALQSTGIKNRKIIIPLNYGEFDTASYVSKHIASEDNHIVILRKFIPKNEYFELLNECSYAIFGVIRQQALGNINQCIRQGIKVFLYKDSICYKSLIESGFRVFTIEDMDIMALSTPLSEEENRQNHEAFKKLVNDRINLYKETKKSICEQLNLNL